jgi:hypothetical protein
MREQAYRCFEIVAWPALVWSAFEAAVESATGEWVKVPWSLAMALISGGMVLAARWRAAALRREVGPERMPA